MSAKGYMNDALGVEFIKFFDKSTQNVAHEGPRLLHVDGHGSHITGELIDYAIKNNIHIIGYPPHTTHVLQGHDVVLFSPFKDHYARLALEFYDQHGTSVTKADFLQVLSKAVNASFTTYNIVEAWRKTGLRPVDRSVVTPEMTAPSRLFAPSTTFPASPASPIKGLVNILRHMPPPPLPLDLSNGAGQPADRINSPDSPTTLLVPENSRNPFLVPEKMSAPEQIGIPEESDVADQRWAAQMLETIQNGLSSTRSAFLVSSEPAVSSEELPVMASVPSSELLKSAMKMQLPPSQNEWDTIKGQLSIFITQFERTLARCVMQELHCKRLKASLAARERRKCKGRNAQRLLGTDAGRLLTGRAMVEALAEDERLRQEKEVKSHQSKALAELRNARREWRAAENAKRAAAHEAALAEWELRCLALPPGKRNPKKPTQPAKTKTPARFAAASRRKGPATRRIVGDSDEDVWNSDENQTEDDD